MKAKAISIILLLTGIGLLTQCKPPKADKKETLSVTIDPQKYFLETIVGNRYDINCVVPSGSNPESFDVAPSQMLALSKSIAYFKVGYLGIENTLIEKVRNNHPHLQIFDCSVGIEASQHDHDHDHDHTNCNHGHEGGDPHTWSSPATAKIMVTNMYNAVVKLDSLNKEQYTINYNTLMTDFAKTDSIIKSYIAKAPSKSFIIYHPSLTYFANEYGLEQLPIEYEGKNPSPTQLKDLIDEARADNVKVVFIQQEFDTKNAETIAEAIGAKPITINLLSYYWSEELIKIAKALALDFE